MPGSVHKIIALAFHSRIQIIDHETHEKNIQKTRVERSRNAAKCASSSFLFRVERSRNAALGTAETPQDALHLRSPFALSAGETPRDALHLRSARGSRVERRRNAAMCASSSFRARPSR